MSATFYYTNKVYQNENYMIECKETRSWFVNNKYHREDGPALEIFNMIKIWYFHGLCHRVDGPAVEQINRTEWWQYGLKHRLDGPAVEWKNGNKEWWQRNRKHREDGPAVEYAHGGVEYWFLGKLYSLEDYRKLLKL